LRGNKSKEYIIIRSSDKFFNLNSDH